MSIRKLRSVLCVDDDADICEVVQASLCLIAGLDVSVTRSGARVLEIAEACRPDLILMDIMMPGLDGPTIFGQLRANPPTADIAVIFLTAKVMPAERDRLLQLGALGVIAKPFDPLKLADQVFELWDQTAKPRAASAAAAQFKEHFDNLEERFIDRARSDVNCLRLSIEQARQGDPSALAEVQRTAHSIHGTGAMLGFSPVSAAAEAVECLAARVNSNPESHGPIGESALVYEIAECIERLAQAVESSAHTRSLDAGMLQLRRASR